MNLSTYTKTEKGLNQFINFELSNPVELNTIQSVILYSDILNTSINNHIIKKIRFETTENVPLQFSEVQVWVDNSNLLQNNLSYSNNITYNLDFRVASSTSITDSIGGLNATYNGGMSSTVSDGATFDGTNDWIGFSPYLDSTSGFSFEIYYYLSNSSDSRVLLDLAYDTTWNTSTQKNLTIFTTMSGSAKFRPVNANGSSHSYFTGVSVSLNTWIHVVYTRDAAGTGKIYINGTLSETKSPNGVFAAGSRPSSVLGAGSRLARNGNVTFGDEQRFNGKVRYLRIFNNKELTSSQVTEMYNNREERINFSSYQSSNLYDLSNTYDNSFSTYASTNSGLGEYFDFSFNGFNFNDLQAIVAYNYTTDNSNIVKTKLTLYDDSDNSVSEVSNLIGDTNTNVIKYKGPNYESAIPKFQKIRFQNNTNSSFNLNELQVWTSVNNLLTDVVGSNTTVTTNSYNSFILSGSDRSLTDRFTTNVLTLVNSPTFDNSGVTLANSSPYITVPTTLTNLGTNDFTFSFWYSPLTDTSNAYNHIFAMPWNNIDGDLLIAQIFETREFSIVERKGGTNISRGLGIISTANTDYNFVITRKSNLIRVFINNVEKTSFTYTASINNRNFRLGNSEEGHGINASRIFKRLDIINNFVVSNPNLLTNLTNTIESNLYDDNITTLFPIGKTLGNFIDVSLNQAYDLSSLSSIVAYSNYVDENPLIKKIRITPEENMVLDISEVQVWVDNSNVATSTNQLLTDGDFTTDESSNNYFEFNFNNEFEYDKLQGIVIYNKMNSTFSNDLSQVKFTFYDSENIPKIEYNSTADASYNIYSPHLGGTPSRNLINVYKYKGKEFESSISKINRFRIQTTANASIDISEIQLFADGSNVIVSRVYNQAVTADLIATKSVTMPSNYNGNLMNFPQSIFGGAMGSNTKTVSGLTGDLSLFNGTYSITWSSNHEVPYSSNQAHYMFSATNHTNQYGSGDLNAQFRYPNNNVPYNSNGAYTGSNFITYQDDNGNSININGEWFAFEFPAYINFTKVHHIGLDPFFNDFYWVGRDSDGINRLVGTYSLSLGNGFWRFGTLTNNYYVNKLYFVIPQKRSNLAYFTVFDIFFDGKYQVSPAGYSNLYNSIITQSSTLNSDISANVNDSSFNTISSTEKGFGEFLDVSLNYSYDVSKIEGLVIYSSYKGNTNPTITKIRYQTYDNVKLQVGEFQVWVDNSNIASQTGNTSSSINGDQDLSNLNDSNLYTYTSTNQGTGEYIDIAINNSFSFNDLQGIVTYIDETAGNLIYQNNTKLILYDDSDVPVIELSNNFVDPSGVASNLIPDPKYSFDFRNGSTTTYDQVSNVVATAYGGVTFSSNGASLDGTNDYIETTTNISISGEVSFEFYIQFTPQGTDDPGVIYVISDDNDGLSITNSNQTYAETPQGYAGNSNAQQLYITLNNAQNMGSEEFDPRFNNLIYF